MHGNSIQPILPGLHASAPEPLPFDESLEIRTFLLHRDQGTLAIYNTITLSPDTLGLAELGGVSRRYFNHWHEAMIPSGGIDAPLYCHERDLREIAARTAVHEAFLDRHILDSDFEVIPTPGHTAGSTAFLWSHGGHRYLFTSDSIYLRDGEWVATLLGESDRAAYIESLELLRELEFDVLVPWAATRGQPFVTRTDRADASRRIGAILKRLRGGGSS